MRACSKIGCYRALLCSHGNPQVTGERCAGCSPWAKRSTCSKNHLLLAGFPLLAHACSSAGRLVLRGMCPGRRGTPRRGERWMVRAPQKRQRYPLPTGKEQALALAAEEELFTRSAGTRFGNPSLRLQPKGFGCGSAPSRRGRWLCHRLCQVGKSRLSCTEGRRKQRRAVWFARGSGKERRGSEFSSPVHPSSSTGSLVRSRKRKR